MTLTVQTLELKNRIGEPIGKIQKVEALSSFIVNVDGELVDITGLDVGKAVYMGGDKKGFAFRKISDTEGLLQIRNIVAGESKYKGTPVVVTTFPAYPVLETGQTATVSTVRMTNSDSVTAAMRRKKLSVAAFTELREIAWKAQTENNSHDWAMRDQNVLSFSLIPNRGEGLKIIQKVQNMWDREWRIIGLVSRIVRKFENSLYTGIVPTQFASVTEDELAEVMGKVRAEFNIDAFSWFKNADEGKFFAKNTSKSVHFSGRTGAKKTLKYDPAGTALFTTTSSADWDKLRTDYSDLMQGFDE